MPATPSTHIYRGDYGQILECSQPDGVPAPADYSNARQLLAEALSAGLLPEAYCRTISRDRYEALNYDIYDFSPTLVLVQQRFTEKRKYVTIQKDYLLISRGENGIAVEDVKYAKHLVIRTAKATKLNFGWVLDRVIGRREARRMAPRKR